MAKEQFQAVTKKYWVTEFNFLDEVRQQFDLPTEVRIHDVTLRECEQAPHVALTPEEKLRIYEALDDLGVYSVEIFPVVSDEEKELAREMVKRKRNTKVIFLCRWNTEEVDFAIENGADGVVVEGTANPFLARVAVNGVTEDEMLAKFVQTTAHAKKNGMYTVVMPWDTCRAPIEYLERLYKGIVYEGGADRVVIADSHGSSLPFTIAAIVRKLRGWVPGVPVEMHVHNDFGLATSIMLGAVSAGASGVHTSVTALGERAGNAATEEVALCLELLLGIPTGLKLERLIPLAEMVAEIAKMPIARNKPVVGDNEFTIGSGMVVYMNQRELKHGERSAGAYMPQLLGRSGFNYVLNKTTGAAAVAFKLEKLGIEATKEQIAEITQRVKREASIRKWSVPDNALEVIARDVLQGK